MVSPDGGLIVFMMGLSRVIGFDCLCDICIHFGVMQVVHNTMIIGWGH